MTSPPHDFPPIPDFDYDPRTRLVFGAGALARLGEFASELGGGRVLLVSDPGLRDAGHEQRALGLLEAAGMQVRIFDDVPPNPTTDDVDKGARFAQSLGIDLIIGLGGGSSMDCAKGINFLLTNGGRMEDYRGMGQARNPLLPMIAVPTTAGTGSEAQSYAVISHAQSHEKMACGDKRAAPRVALLDPELTLTMPASVTAFTGIDAISHAVESYVTTRRNPISQLFARRAWRMLSQAFPVVVEQPDNLAARGAMLLGAHLAGAAIENSMLGATHALANPVTARFDVTHGVAIGVLLPHVVRFNAPAVDGLYGQLCADAGISVNGTPAAEPLAKRLRHFVALSGGPTTLAECGVDPTQLETMSREAGEQWTGRFNPRPAGPKDFEELYRCALSPA
ncbi:MAG: iron-containing alcohol dehydrogenase [Planctomyces sp.]|nr:iron-containing alcohol dehydrogenase [Planctomyces sp.]